MKKNKRTLNPVTLLTGKYGILLLTIINVCLACLVVTIAGRWHFLDRTSYTNTDFMTYYLLDFRVGFVSRALIGSLLYLFTHHPTVRMVTNILITAVILSMLLFAYLQAQIAKKALQTGDYAALLLSCLFYLNSLFWCNTFEYFGHTDIFMTLLMQIYLICTEKKRMLGYILAPVVCTVGLLIHTSFPFVGFVVVGAVLWFDMLQHGKPDRIRIALFCTACLVSVVLFIVFVFFTRETVRVSPDELMQLMRKKYDGQIDEEYFIAYLFRIGIRHSAITEDYFLRGLFDVSRIDFASSKIRRNMLNILPLTAAFFAGFIFHMRRSGSRKIAYLGFPAPFIALFPALTFSTDRERFFSLFILAQYMLLHYIMTQTDVHFLPCETDLPTKKLPPAARKRKRLANGLLIVCAAVGLAYTLLGLKTL